jgi:hypothetical protein
MLLDYEIVTIKIICSINSIINFKVIVRGNCSNIMEIVIRVVQRTEVSRKEKPLSFSSKRLSFVGATGFEPVTLCL